MEKCKNLNRWIIISISMVHQDMIIKTEKNSSGSLCTIHSVMYIHFVFHFISDEKNLLLLVLIAKKYFVQHCKNFTRHREKEDEGEE